MEALRDAYSSGGTQQTAQILRLDVAFTAVQITGEESAMSVLLRRAHTGRRSSSDVAFTVVPGRARPARDAYSLASAVMTVQVLKDVAFTVVQEVGDACDSTWQRTRRRSRVLRGLRLFCLQITKVMRDAFQQTV